MGERPGHDVVGLGLWHRRKRSQTLDRDARIRGHSSKRLPGDLQPTDLNLLAQSRDVGAGDGGVALVTELERVGHAARDKVLHRQLAGVYDGRHRHRDGDVGASRPVVPAIRRYKLIADCARLVTDLHGVGVLAPNAVCVFTRREPLGRDTQVNPPDRRVVNPVDLAESLGENLGHIVKRQRTPNDARGLGLQFGEFGVTRLTHLAAEPDLSELSRQGLGGLGALVGGHQRDRDFSALKVEHLVADHLALLLTPPVISADRGSKVGCHLG